MRPEHLEMLTFRKFYDPKKVLLYWLKRAGIVLAILAALGLLANVIGIIYSHNKYVQQDKKGCPHPGSSSFVRRKDVSKDSIRLSYPLPRKYHHGADYYLGYSKHAGFM